MIQELFTVRSLFLIPPGLWDTPDAATVVLGREAVFTCVSRGEATVTWLYQDGVMASTNSSYSDSNWLTIATFHTGTMGGNRALGGGRNG